MTGISRLFHNKPVSASSMFDFLGMTGNRVGTKFVKLVHPVLPRARLPLERPFHHRPVLPSRTTGRSTHSDYTPIVVNVRAG